MKSARERAEEKRQEKLELVQEQVESGALTIRQMTEEEREANPPRPPQPKRPAAAEPPLGWPLSARRSSRRGRRRRRRTGW